MTGLAMPVLLSSEYIYLEQQRRLQDSFPEEFWDAYLQTGHDLFERGGGLRVDITQYNSPVDLSFPREENPNNEPQIYGSFAFKIATIRKGGSDVALQPQQYRFFDLLDDEVKLANDYPSSLLPDSPLLSIGEACVIDSLFGVPLGETLIQHSPNGFELIDIRDKKKATKECDAINESLGPRHNVLEAGSLVFSRGADLDLVLTRFP